MGVFKHFVVVNVYYHVQTCPKIKTEKIQVLTFNETYVFFLLLKKYQNKKKSNFRQSKLCRIAHFKLVVPIIAIYRHETIATFVSESCIQ